MSHQSNSNRTCKGLCKNFQIKKPSGVGRYSTGQARCQICDIWISYKGCHFRNGEPATEDSLGWFCNCCNYRVRTRPRNKIYKEKLHERLVGESSTDSDSDLISEEFEESDLETESNIQENQYKVWLWAVSYENWNILKEKNVWASGDESKIRHMVRPHDKVVFYVSKVMEIKGIYEFTSEWYDTKEPLWYEEEIPIKFVSQIKIKPILIGSLDIHSTIDKLKIFENRKSDNVEKMTNEQSLVLKPGNDNMPSNFGNPIPHEDLLTIMRLMKPLYRSLDYLEFKGVSKTHVAILKKFLVLSGEIIEDSSRLQGIKGESPIPADDLVPVPHYLHNLVRGVYKPKGDEFALSILTNPSSEWGVEIDFHGEGWTINYDFRDGQKYASDIESLKKCYLNEIPIGVIYRHKKGVNEILGLGRIVSTEETSFFVSNYDSKISEDLSEAAFDYAQKQCKEGDYSSPPSEVSVIRRSKQQWFRDILIQEYGGQCAFCGLGIEDYLIGSHIVPFNVMQKEDPQNAMNPSNGLLLCRLCDVAFEKGHVLLDEDYHILGTEFLKNEMESDSMINVWASHIHDKIPDLQSSQFAPDKKYILRKLEINTSVNSNLL